VITGTVLLLAAALWLLHANSNSVGGGIMYSEHALLLSDAIRSAETGLGLLASDVVPAVAKKNQTTTLTTTTTDGGGDERLRKLDALLEKEGLKPRIWNKWSSSQQPLPCFEPPGPKGFRSRDLRGFLFIKPAKSGSSTGASVTLRLATRLSKRFRSQFQDESKKLCKCAVEHKLASTLGIYKRNRKESYLWSVLRNPVPRMVSQFFHFHVSRRNASTDDASFQKYLKSENNFQDYFVRYLMGRVPPERARVRHVERHVRQILQEYNFLAVTERMDESVVALQMLLGLETADVVFLKSKSSGGYDDGRFHNKCFRIVPSFVSDGMKRYFATPKFKADIYWDELLYHAVNRSLDLTIDSLGRSEFEQQLSKFRDAQQRIAQRCSDESKVKYPCSSTGEKRKDEDTDCIFNDWGCGFDCIDESLSSGDASVTAV